MLVSFPVYSPRLLGDFLGLALLPVGFGFLPAGFMLFGRLYHPPKKRIIGHLAS